MYYCVILPLFPRYYKWYYFNRDIFGHSNAENVFSKGSGAYLRAVEFLAVFRLRDAFLSPENEKCGADAAKTDFRIY